MKKVDVFETHSWKMVRIHNNHLGEPVYIAACEKCLMTIPEAREAGNPCRGSPRPF